MKAKKYASTIKLKKSSLDVEVSYECRVTQEEEERMRDYYQWRFSQRAGRQVPREEIKVKPAKGDSHELITFFRVKLRRPLYTALFVQEKAPYVLPLLIEDLKKYREEHNLHGYKARLIQHAIKGLAKIIASYYSKVEQRMS